jgi:SAM-dependent methyltransferase
MRTLIYMLSLELFGEALTLPEFPQYGHIKGFGMSDAHCYALPLAEKVNYTNTFYDREPYLDITVPHPDQYGAYDFILSSDVFEHVAPPVGRAFEEAFRLLKPNGFLCITVPSAIADETVEHYPDLHQYSVVELAGEHVLINRKQDKTLEIYGNLVFHGGIGTTLEMRLFGQADLVRKLRAAGFSDVVLQMEPAERFGIVFDGRWSRPLVARKQPFAKLPAVVSQAGSWSASKAELDARIARLQKDKVALEERLERVEKQLRLASGSRWLGLGRRLGLGPNLERYK